MRVTQSVHQYMTLYCAKLKSSDQLATALASRPIILPEDCAALDKQYSDALLQMSRLYYSLTLVRRPFVTPESAIAVRNPSLAFNAHVCRPTFVSS